MTDTPQDQTPEGTQNAQDSTKQQAPLVMLGQYIKDLSFEVPGAPDIFRKMTSAPEIGINVDVQARQLQQQNTFEVTLHFEAEGRVGEERAFIAELVYGAMVQVNPQEPSHIQPLLLVEAPRLMFPFARNVLADATREGGFPPLMLQPIDFVQLFRQRLEAAQRQKQAEQAEGNSQG